MPSESVSKATNKKEVLTQTETKTEPQLDIITTGTNPNAVVEPILEAPYMESPEEQSGIIDPDEEDDRKYAWMDQEPYPNMAPNFRFNNLTELEYRKYKFAVPDKIKKSEEKRFLNEVDITKGDIEREITSMWRIYWPDYSDPKRPRKEFLKWYENWRGKNWLGGKIAPVTGHLQGEYNKLDREPVIDERTHRISKYKIRHGPKVMYVPFSKEVVDKILSDSIGSDQDTVTFGIFNGIHRLGPLSYEDFTTKSFDECREILKKKQ